MKKGIIALLAAVALISCANSTTAKNSESGVGSQTTKSVEQGCVEVLYMHGKQRCVTCVAIGTEALSVVEEFTTDKVVMKTIDFSTEEGEKIADKYEVASSSLILVKDGKVENLTAMAFQYAKNNPEQFRKNLKKSIQKMID